ncbi:MAG: MlaD family protein [Burkholderiaceae bacterium]|jgi:phospholipid/cholesterol/gamma-HCH transport system substrate-binding protein|nr:MlaD family protein [Burkholderiaceae bacterium]
MENKAHALAAGLFVLAMTALLAGLAAWLLRDTASTVVYQLSSRDAVSGLQPQAAVRFKGVAVGKVTAISFDPGTRGNVLITVAIDKNAPVTASTFASLAYQGVTGLSFVQLDDDGSSTAPLPPFEGGPPRIPIRANFLGRLTDQAQMLIGKLDQTVDHVNQLLGDENQAVLTSTLKELNSAASNISQMAQNADAILKAQLTPGKTNIPQMIDQATATLASVQEAATDARAAINGLKSQADGVLAQVDGSVSRFGATTLPGIQAMTRDVSHAARRVDRAAGIIGDTPQSLLFGNGPIPPGPGEPGFAPHPEAALPEQKP